MPTPPHADFDIYFHQRASRFAAFYSSERVARLLGRGALFDRLRGAVEMVVASGARSVLDVGCGSGPLFAPLAKRAVAVVGIDPAPAMVTLARRQAERFGELVQVQERRWEDIDEVDAYGAATALGVFDYVDEPGQLLAKMGRAAPHVVASFPAHGLRLRLRQVRYGAKGVGVHGYSRDRLRQLAADNHLELAEVRPLGRAGFLAHFSRSGGAAPR